MRQKEIDEIKGSPLDKTVAKVTTALVNLAKVEAALRFLAANGVVRDDAIAKGCRKFVEDHPEIRNWIDSDRFV